jgi:hypothetical protein
VPTPPTVGSTCSRPPARTMRIGARLDITISRPPAGRCVMPFIGTMKSELSKQSSAYLASRRPRLYQRITEDVHFVIFISSRKAGIGILSAIGRVPAFYKLKDHRACLGLDLKGAAVRLWRRTRAPFQAFGYASPMAAAKRSNLTELLGTCDRCWMLQ